VHLPLGTKQKTISPWVKNKTPEARVVGEGASLPGLKTLTSQRPKVHLGTHIGKPLPGLKTLTSQRPSVGSIYHV
jgi:hypothetical protein